MRAVISISFSCNEEYAKHVAVVIRSILANASIEDRHEFHVLTRDLTPKSEQRLGELATTDKARILIHRIDASRLVGLPETHLPLEAYFRLLLPEILPAHEKVLYLDADLLVLGSLWELWNFNIEDCAVAAAIDIMTVIGSQQHLQHFEILQLSKEQLYFNSGVLLLNLKNIKELQLLENVRAWAEKHSDLMFCSDQEPINVILAGKCKYFHLRYNLQVTLITLFQYGHYYNQQQLEAVSNPIILHYITERKPWRREFKLPYQNLYFYYRSQTPWQEDQLEPLTFYQIKRRLLAEFSWIYRSLFLKYWFSIKKYINSKQ